MLTVAANEFLGVAPFLKVVTARGHRVHELRARRPGDRPWRALSAILPQTTPSQVAGSPGGVAFMIAAVSFIIVDDRRCSAGRRRCICGGCRASTSGRFGTTEIALIAVCFTAAIALSIAVLLLRHALGSEGAGRDGIAAGPKNRTRLTHPHPNAAAASEAPRRPGLACRPG